jgi:hypothetical protein
LISRLIPTTISTKQKDSLTVFAYRLLGSKIGPADSNGDEFQVVSSQEKKFLSISELQFFQLVESIKRKLAGSVDRFQFVDEVFSEKSIAGTSEGAGDALLFSEAYRNRIPSLSILQPYSSYNPIISK